jgi:hypothetical protein
MYNPQRISCEADDLPADDIDELFEKLQAVKPPPELIRRILVLAAGHPRPGVQSDPSIAEAELGKSSHNGVDAPVKKDHELPS